MSSITLSTRFTREDLATLEDLIEEYGDTVRNEWAYVTFGDVVDRLEGARERRNAEEAQRQQEEEQEEQEEQAEPEEGPAEEPDEATSALATFLRKLADKLS